MSLRRQINAQLRLAGLLKQHRLDAGLRQIDLAERLKQPQSYISKYEAGERSLTLIELQSICSAMGVPLLLIVKQFEEGSH